MASGPALPFDGRVRNLTEVAHRLRMGERPDVPRAFRRDGVLVEIVTPADVDAERGAADRDTLYLVTGGYGVLRSGDEEVEFAHGDVLFVAAGVERRCERLGRKFGAWKIRLATPNPGH